MTTLVLAEIGRRGRSDASDTVLFYRKYSSGRAAGGKMVQEFIEKG